MYKNKTYKGKAIKKYGKKKQTSIFSKYANRPKPLPNSLSKYMELKRVYTGMAPVAFDGATAFNLQLANGVVQGALSNNRIGNHIYLEGLELEFNIVANANTIPSFVRIMIVECSTTLTLAEMPTPSLPPNASFNSKYILHYDKTDLFAPATTYDGAVPDRRTYKIQLSIKRNIPFVDASSINQAPQFHIVCTSDSGTANAMTTGRGQHVTIYRDL